MRRAGQDARFGRGKALAILGGVVLTLFAVAAGPYIWLWHINQVTAEQRVRAGELEREIQRLAGARERLRRLADPEVAKSLLLAGQTSGLNGANLQQRVATIATRSGIDVQSLRLAEPEAWGDELRRIPLEVGFRAPIDRVLEFLYAVETAQPLIFIDALTLSAIGEGEPVATDPLDVVVGLHGVAHAKSGSWRDKAELAIRGHH